MKKSIDVYNDIIDILNKSFREVCEFSLVTDDSIDIIMNNFIDDDGERLGDMCSEDIMFYIESYIEDNNLDILPYDLVVINGN